MSPSPATVKSLAERRVRRQKIFIALGSVVLLAILGFELPKVLGGKDGNQAAVAQSTTSPAAAAAAPVVPAGQLPGDRVVVQRDSNQLISFGLFKSKDPFVQQLTTSASPTPSAPPASAPPTDTTATTSAEPTPPVVLLPVGPSSSSSTTSSSPSSPSAVPNSTTPSAPPPPPVPTEALIATNGICERVAVKGTFPATENIFRLVSIAKDGKSVEIGIVGGSFDSGQPTATLKQGDKLTLVNTADGTRYVIELKAKCAGLDTTQPGAQTTTTTSQPVPTTPVSPAPAPTPTTTTTTTTDTVTTPIVTDAEDTTPPSS